MKQLLATLTGIVVIMAIQHYLALLGLAVILGFWTLDVIINGFNK